MARAIVLALADKKREPANGKLRPGERLPSLAALIEKRSERFQIPTRMERELPI
jgi:hypothetical protein